MRDWETRFCIPMVITAELIILLHLNHSSGFNMKPVRLNYTTCLNV